MKKTLTITVMAFAAALTGCANMNGMNEGIAPGRGTSRNLSNTSYQQAFATARQVLSQYYSIASADPATGIIKSRPKPVEAGKERLLGGSPARQIATLQISQENGNVIAQLVVVQQRQGSEARRQMGYSAERSNYSGLPGDETPADIDAATTSKQNQAWQTEKHLPSVETKILNDLVAEISK